MSTKSWIIFTAVCVLLFGGLLFWSQRNRVDVSDVNTNTILSASKESGDIADHVDGNADAKVILIEYGDFQCPGCGGVHPTVKSLMEKYGDHVAFVFRNFPLTSIHPNAKAAAGAAEAAGLQGEGAYWKMHNHLFEHQQEWQGASTSERGKLFSDYAKAIGIDQVKFNTALTDESVRLSRKIEFDQALGRKLNVTGTPTFYLNGTQLTEEQINGEEAFESTLTTALKDAGVTLEDETTKE